MADEIDPEIIILSSDEESKPQVLFYNFLCDYFKIFVITLSQKLDVFVLKFTAMRFICFSNKIEI